MTAALYKKNKTIEMESCASVVPGPGEVRLKVAYTGICGTDVHIYHGKMDARIKGPQPIGHEMAGYIEEIGPGVQGYAIGDHVTVRPLDYEDDGTEWKREGAHIRPGLKFLGIDTPGSFQKYWTVPTHTLHKLPSDLALDKAALTEPLAVACHDIRIGHVRKGETVVVLGGGPIGVLIACVARAEGAKVLVSEINPFRLKLLAELGIEAINPKEQDLTKVVLEQTNGIGADVVFEVTGTQAGCDVMTTLIAVRGRIVIVGIFSEAPKIDLFQFFWKELQLFGARVYEPEDFEKAIALAAKGDLPLEKIISKTVNLEELGKTFEEISSGADLMKVLVRCS